MVHTITVTFTLHICLSMQGLLKYLFPSDQDQTGPGKTQHSENCNDKQYTVKTVA